jgi:hypothetical protein
LKKGILYEILYEKLPAILCSIQNLPAAELQSDAMEIAGGNVHYASKHGVYISTSVAENQTGYDQTYFDRSLKTDLPWVIFCVLIPSCLLREPSFASENS